MIFLLSSIILSSYLTLAFKITGNYKISNLQAIVFNYITCVITGSIINGKTPFTQDVFKAPWFIYAVIMGVMFISLFNVIAYTAQKMGVSVTSVANKLSLVIPFLFSLYLYNDSAGIFKWLGVALALISVVLVSYRKKDVQATNNNLNFLAWLLPAVLFAGSGLLDALINYTEQVYINDANKNDFLITAFSTAAFSGIIIMSIHFLTGRQKFQPKALLAGICIGVPNYFSIWCMMAAIALYSSNSSAIIPVNNMGIVLFSAVAAWLLFKEKLNAINCTGIILSLAAIALIAFT
jgi:drug/metabolite transporter (DMT)-like permease